MAKNLFVLDDEVLKDNFGNGKFNLKMEKKTLFTGNIKYSFEIIRDEAKQISKCTFVKTASEGHKVYTFNLMFDGLDPSKNYVTYEKKDFGVENTYDILKTDVMFNAKIRKEELKVLKEFDMVMWNGSGRSESKNTLVDVITDVIDTTERDDAVIGNEKVSDVDLIHMAFKGFFAEIKTNVEQVSFEE
ncbi:MAG: hypothetical protein MJ246_03960 [Clostridia bacterium]|nr:hypothetical protein [Clostridia bacterium]